MTIKVVLGNYIIFPTEVPHEVTRTFKWDLTFKNPAIQGYMIRVGRVPHWIPQHIQAYEIKDGNYYLPRGYWGKLQIILAQNHVQYTLDDQRTLYETESFGNNIWLEKHQAEPVETMLPVNEGILQAPCGSGKSVMALKIACEWGQPTLVLAHTNSIMNQWTKFIKKFTYVKPGLIHGNKWDIGDITVASVMTLVNREFTDEFRRYFGTVILDEAHHAPAHSFQQVLTQFYAKHRIGVTATPRREDGLQGLLLAVTGQVQAQVDQEELFRSGYNIRPTIHVVPTNFHYREVHKGRIADHKIHSAIEADEPRAIDVARKAVRNRDRSVLVLSRRIAHLATIEAAIRRLDPDIKMEVLTGRLSESERKSILLRLRKKKLNVVLATQVADEGLDIPRLDVLLLAFPSSGGIKLEQQVGRVMRAFKGKAKVDVYDFVDQDAIADIVYYDPLTHRQKYRQVYRLMDQYAKRLTFYKRQKYPILGQIA